MPIFDMEGFERLPTGVIAPSTARVLDEMGWMLGSADPSVPVAQRTAIEVSTVNANKRGKAVTITAAATNANAFGQSALVKSFSMGSMTKVVLGFNLFVHSTNAQFNNPYSQMRFGSTPTAVDWTNVYFVFVALAGGDLYFAGTRTNNGSYIGKWTFIEIVLDKSTGLVSWYTNGALVNSFSVGASAFDAIRNINFGGYSTYTADFGKFTVDDFYWDNQSGQTTKVLGRGKVDLAVPNANVSTAFTPNGVAQNWQALTPPLNPTTFNSSPNEGALDIVELDNPLADSPDDLVQAVMTTTVARTSNGTQGLVAGVGSGTSFQKTSLTITTASSASNLVSSVNPATGQPWTIADLENLRTGYAVKTWPTA